VPRPDERAPHAGDPLPTTRRGFLKSLSRTALVLSLEDVLSLSAPVFAQAQQPPPQQPKGSARQSYEAAARPAPKGAYSPVTGTPLGVQFVDVAKEAGLNVETIFGGKHPDSKAFPRAANQFATSSKTIATAPSPTSP
jgi:hypothetical protein